MYNVEIWYIIVTLIYICVIYLFTQNPIPANTLPPCKSQSGAIVQEELTGTLNEY